MPTPPTLILVRHGQSEHHVRGLTGGWTDTPLTPLGHQQAHLVAGRLQAELSGAPVRVIASDLVRASQTATHIADGLGVELEHDARLREHNNGESVNMTIADARAKWPGTVDMRMATRMVPGAETGAEFYARARSFVEDLDNGGGLPIVVTHGGTIRMLIAAWLRLTEEALDYAHFAAHPTGITVLVSWNDGRERMVERVSDLAHLSGTQGFVGLRDATR